MATKKKIVYNLLNIYEAGRLNDDFTPSYQQMSFIVDYKRAEYIRQDQTKNYFDSEQFYQDLGCVSVIKVDKAECCEVDFGCDVARTSIQIPAFLRLSNRYGLKISAVDKTSRFQQILPERTAFYKDRKYPSMTIPFYIINNYIYFPYTENMVEVNVRAILSEPEKAKTFVCSGSACYTDDSEYPISEDMINLINKDVFTTEIKMLMMTVVDKENDGQDTNNER
jgi:hypothetical protein